MNTSAPGARSRYRLWSWLARIVAAATISVVPATPGFSAERVKLQFGFLSRTVPVSSLVTFANDGTVDEHLAPFFQSLDDETLATFQAALATPRAEDPVAFSQKLYSPMGTRLLQSTGLTVRTGSGLNGQTASDRP